MFAIPKVSNTNSVFSDFEWLGESIISVSSNEILEQELRVSEVTSVILE